MNRISNLATLQVVDSRIAQLRSQIEAGQYDLATDSTLDDLRKAESGSREDAAKGAQVSHAAEHLVAELRHHAQRLERRLYDGSVGNPAELVGMQKELKAVQEKLVAAEAELLVAMETDEALDSELRGAEAAVGQRTTEREASRPEAGNRLAEQRAELASSIEERQELAAGLEASDLTLYTRVSARISPAVVQLSGNACGGCHLPLGIEEVHIVRANSTLVQCSNCERIVTA